MTQYVIRPYFFTASLCPSVIASTRAALRILQTRPELRTRLWNNARRLYDRLKELGFKLGPTLSPIIAALFERREVAIASWNGLLEQGVYVNMILPPAAPEGGSLLRCSISAAHTEEQIDRIVEAFAAVRAVTESPRQRT